MIFIMKLHGKNVNKPRSPRSQTYTELLTLFSTPQTSRWTLRLSTRSYTYTIIKRYLPITFWYGYGSSDPNLGSTDSDPTLFFRGKIPNQSFPSYFFDWYHFRPLVISHWTLHCMLINFTQLNFYEK